MKSSDFLGDEQVERLKKNGVDVFRQVPTVYRQCDMAKMFGIAPSTMSEYLDNHLEDLEESFEGHVFLKGNTKVYDRHAVEAVAKLRGDSVPDELIVDYNRDMEHIAVIQDYLFSGISLDEMAAVEEIKINCCLEGLAELNKHLERERAQFLKEIVELKLENEFLRRRIKNSEVYVDKLRKVIRTFSNSNESMIKAVTALFKAAGAENLKLQKDVVQDIVRSKMPDFLKDIDIVSAEEADKLIDEASKKAKGLAQKAYGKTYIMTSSEEDDWLA